MAWNEEAQIRCRFQFICLQQWSKLQPTEQADVRRHGEQRHCIAVPVGREGENHGPRSASMSSAWSRLRTDWHDRGA